MPTDFDWNSWKKKQKELDPLPPEEPKFIKFMEILANTLMFSVIIIVLLTLYAYSEEAAYILKVVDRCHDQNGIAVRTVKGDTVCIKEDVLTEVLGKNTTQAK